WLDAASSITYPTAFTGKERKVYISGQAYFEVAKNKEMPFVVQKGDMSIKVLGTHFNVNAYEDEGAVKTTLLEGIVKIDQGSFSTMIKPGQQIQIARNGSSRLIQNADLDEAVAWKNGFFKFDHCDLPSVMRQLARWYDVTVVYQGNMPAQYFGGKMERDLNLSEILDGLGKSGVHFKIEGKRLFIMP
ncbi:MAG TPA: FecR domain-containing protein, partial [Puia sp.]|nr:FecR domain-containing protein [Puia sp.]